MWVSPFRHLRVIGYLLLAAAFRSLSRLSSALSAKASTLRSFLLDHLSPFAIALATRAVLYSNEFLNCLSCLLFALFSDVLIYLSESFDSLLILSIISLYEVFKVHFVYMGQGLLSYGRHPSVILFFDCFISHSKPQPPEPLNHW